jgi:hypothetical protein
MDSHGQNNSAAHADDEDEIRSLVRDGFQWPEPPARLRADIIRRLAELCHELKAQSRPIGMPSSEISLGGVERSQGSLSAPHLPP